MARRNYTVDEMATIPTKIDNTHGYFVDALFKRIKSRERGGNYCVGEIQLRIKVAATGGRRMHTLRREGREAWYHGMEND